MPQVLKVKKGRIEQLKVILLRNGLVSELKPTNPYEAFRFKCGTEVIVGYTTGKIVATGEESKKVLSQALLQLQPEGILETIIGSDEAGKGEWLGPLVVAAVALSPEESLILTAEGVMDSKLLSPSKIRELAGAVKKVCIEFKTVVIPPSRFNELMWEAKDEGKSLNDMLAWAHSVAIKPVLDKAVTQARKVRIVIDEFDKIKTEDRLRRLIDLKKFEVSQYPKAEEEVAVAAASILARDEREYWIDSESRRKGEDLRRLMVAEALQRSDSYSFAKINYLRLGSSEKDLSVSKFLQNVITLEHLLMKLSNSLGVSVKGVYPSDFLDRLRKKEIVTDNLLEKAGQVLNARNRLVHGRDIDIEELAGVAELTAYLVDKVREIVREIDKSKINK